MLSLLVGPKVITLSGFYCSSEKQIKLYLLLMRGLDADFFVTIPWEVRPPIFYISRFLVLKDMVLHLMLFVYIIKDLHCDFCIIKLNSLKLFENDVTIFLHPCLRKSRFLWYDTSVHLCVFVFGMHYYFFTILTWGRFWQQQCCPRRDFYTHTP